MAGIIKTHEQIEQIRIASKHLAEVVAFIIDKVAPGMNVDELDTLAYNKIIELGDLPSFKGYKPYGVSVPFPKTLCISINEEVVHGIPKEKVFLKEGDIVTIDCGLKHNGFFSDHAITVGVGEISKENQELIKVTKDAMNVGISVVRNGVRTGDIGYAIEKFINKRYGIVRELAGHGVGIAVHEDPYISNYGRPHTGDVLKTGMVIAIEPMITIGRTGDVKFHSDGYTVSTKDKKNAAHFEHTVLITDTGYEILTEL